MKVTRFDSRAQLVVVPGVVVGPRGDRRLRLVLDTGAAETMLSTQILDELGYSARQGEATAITRSAVGAERGYMIRVQRLSALQYQMRNFRVFAHDLPDGYDIDGLLGLSFLRQFNIELRFAEGRLLVNKRTRKS